MTNSFEKAWGDKESPLARALHKNHVLTEQDILDIFGAIPRAAERAQVLNEVLGAGSCKSVSDKPIFALASHALSLATGNKMFDTSLAKTLADNFPLGYSDDLLKKSQLAVSGVHRLARDHGSAADCSVTAFADYQIPNVLRHIGVLSYSDDLAQKIDRGDLIDENSPEEKAIRAASILAVEKLADHFGASTADIDFWIWLRRKEPKTPFHLTKTNKY